MPEVAGALFYERLFTLNPDFRSLYKNDMRVEGVKLMTMLAGIVYNLHLPGQVQRFGTSVTACRRRPWNRCRRELHACCPRRFPVCCRELAGEMKAAAKLPP
jgi:hypothetical protein